MTEAAPSPDEQGYELPGRHRVQKAKQAWKTAHDVEQGAAARLEKAERECDEIAEHLAAQGVDADRATGLEWYPAPNSPGNPLGKEPPGDQ